MNRPNKQELGCAKRIMETFFAENGLPSKFHANLQTLKSFDGTDFSMFVGEKNTFIDYHPRKNEHDAVLTFSVKAQVVDYWHTSEQPQLSNTPRRCDGVMLLSIVVEVEHYSLKTSEAHTCWDILLYHGTLKGEMKADSMWRFAPLTEKELRRGDLKGGHPWHRVDHQGNVSLSPRYAYGRRGYVTWGTTRTDTDGVSRIDRGIWYSELSASEWLSRLPSTPKDVETQLRHHYRPHWFTKRPLPALDEEHPELPKEITDQLGRKHQAYHDKLENIFFGHPTVAEEFFTSDESRETA